MKRRLHPADGSSILAVLFLATAFILLAGEVVKNVQVQASASRQIVGWGEAYVTAQSGIEVARARLEEGLTDSFTIANPSRRTGEGSGLSEVRVTVEKLTSYSKPVYRVRSAGHQSLSVFARPTTKLTGLSWNTSSIRRFYYRQVGTEILTQPIAQRSLEAIITQEPSSGPRFAIQTVAGFQLQHHKAIVDSFNSDDPDHSGTKKIGGVQVSGLYDDDNHLENGDIATTTLNPDEVEIFGKIYGSLFTNIVNKIVIGIDDKRKDSQKNNGFVNATGTIDTRFSTLPDNVLEPSWDYGTYVHSPNLLQSGNQTLQAGPPGAPARYRVGEWTRNATLSLPPGQAKGEIEIWVEGDINLNGNGSLVVSPGVSAKIYFQNGINTSGPAIDNQNYRASTLQFFGYRKFGGVGGVNIGSTSSNDIYAVFYAPQHTFSMSGSSDWMGAITARSFTGNSQIGIHYDEALRGNGSGLGTSGDLEMVSMVEILR